MPYTREQDDFIRFVRDDLSHSWETSALLYNQVGFCGLEWDRIGHFALTAAVQYWHPTGEGKREIPGLQSRYYRLLEQPMRDRKRKLEPGPLSRRKAEAKDSLGRPEEGILAKTNRRYYWMEGYYTYEEREQMKREQEQQDGMERVSKRQRREEPDSQDASDHTEKDDDDYEDEEELPDAAPADHASADDDSSHDALPDGE